MYHNLKSRQNLEKNVSNKVTNISSQLPIFKSVVRKDRNNSTSISTDYRKLKNIEKQYIFGYVQNPGKNLNETEINLRHYAY